MSTGKIISTLWENADRCNLPDSVLDNLCCASEISSKLGDMATVVDGIGFLVGVDEDAGNFHADKEGLTSLLFSMGEMFRTASAATFVAADAAAIRHLRHQGYVGGAKKSDRKIASDEDRRRTGAMVAMTGLWQMIEATKNEPDDIRECLTGRDQSVRRFVSTLGGLTPEQQGAFAALAEYIQFSAVSGDPDPDCWVPNAAMTLAEFNAYVERLEAGDSA